MRWLDLIHRWAGGVIGLLLAVLGLSGAILVHKEAWIDLPHADDRLLRDWSATGAAVERLLAGAQGGESVVFASERFGLHQLRLGTDAGAYADQAGNVVASWSSQWQRPELWLFDLHHHLFAGEAGETVAGVAGLAALFFVISGSILWWRTRRSFAPGLLPKRLSRPAIVRHHRDLGILAAPLLVISALTGTMMLFRPVAAFVLEPWGSAAALNASLTPPKLASGLLTARPNVRAMLREAERRYPHAEPRILTLPKKVGEPVSLRVKLPAEWLPNGRTTLWFDAADGRLLASRDALRLPANAQAFNMAYPLHAAKVGGLAYRLLMTAAGLALALLGSLAVWSFWFRRAPRARRGSDAFTLA